uniref:Uncharacterized protein n=1 Tax=Trichobilharzia regenti TaxID=157069 RepID=A0AA85JFM3_TRIRE|nr:unnamed protein product [Trichobilharzia regenti]
MKKAVDSFLTNHHSTFRKSNLQNVGEKFDTPKVFNCFQKLKKVNLNYKLNEVTTEIRQITLYCIGPLDIQITISVHGAKVVSASRAALVVGLCGLVQAAFSAAQHRSYIHLTGQEYSSLLIHILVQTVLSFIVVCISLVGLAGNLREIEAAAEFREKFHQSFDIFLGPGINLEIDLPFTFFITAKLPCRLIPPSNSVITMSTNPIVLTLGHTEAVTTLPLSDHLLASGNADSNTYFWSLDQSPCPHSRSVRRADCPVVSYPYASVIQSGSPAS